jgi:hypothetical protein
MDGSTARRWRAAFQPAGLCVEEQQAHGGKVRRAVEKYPLIADATPGDGRPPNRQAVVVRQEKGIGVCPLLL